MRVAALLLAALTIGCASGSTGSYRDTTPAVVIDNEHWLDVTVSAMRGGMKVRIGRVNGLSSTTLFLPQGLSADVRIVVRAMVTDDGYATEEMHVNPGFHIAITVASDMRMSSYMVLRDQP